MFSKEELTILARSRKALVIVTAAFSSLITAITTLKIANKRFEEKYTAISEQEIAEAKAFYAHLYKNAEEILTPEQMLESLHGENAIKALRTYQGEPDVKIEIAIDEPTQPAIQNIFSAKSTWDYDVELKIREENPGKPYIISAEEYLGAESGYEQVTLTFFREDDVLATDEDRPIDDTDALVGDDNLMHFGHGSNDNNVLYIRNEEREVDFEIIQSMGKYSVEVLGFIEHSDKPRLRKFRESDE